MSDPSWHWYFMVLTYIHNSGMAWISYGANLYLFQIMSKIWASH